jgi:hypothetical protein
MSALFLTNIVRAEPVEALSFFWTDRAKEGQPFDELRANGVCDHGAIK